MTGQRDHPRYRLDRRIATGGMGEVWHATDTVLDREVAVKVLKHEYADDPVFRSRFEAEARNAAALHHPNVASVFDFGELAPEDAGAAPRPFLVMELVPGRPLSDLLREGRRLVPETAAELVAQAADAVASAHALGIVHRDVKPANLLLTPEGAVKITDFGIARAADGAALTQTGQVLGTPAYLSPEQAEGKPATAASDIYSLGVVLYECLAGRRPFAGDTPVSTALAHLRDEPPPLPDHVPARLREVVEVALAKDPRRRFPTMAAFATALRGGAVGAPAAPAAAELPDRPLDPEPVPVAGEAPGGTRTLTAPVPPAGPGAAAPRRPGWLPWAAAALAVLVVVVLASVLTRDDEPSPVAAGGTEPATQGRDQVAADAEPSAREPISLDEQDYLGLPKDEAKARLESLDLKVKDQRTDNPGDHQEDTVAGVSPTSGLRPDDEVLLLVWDKPSSSEDQDDDDDGEDDEAVGRDPKEKPDRGEDKGKKKGHT